MSSLSKPAKRLTRGREMTFLQQLFNATPGVPLGGGDQQQNPGGGGPRR